MSGVVATPRSFSSWLVGTYEKIREMKVDATVQLANVEYQIKSKTRPCSLELHGHMKDEHERQLTKLISQQRKLEGDIRLYAAIYQPLGKVLIATGILRKEVRSRSAALL